MTLALGDLALHGWSPRDSVIIGNGIDFSRFLFLPSESWFVGSTDQESSQQLRTWFSEHFSRQNLLRSLSLVLFLLQRHKYGAKNLSKKKNTFDPTFEMIRF